MLADGNGTDGQFGVRGIAEIAGFGANADAGDLTSPDAGSAARAMQRALIDGKLTPADIGYVNAHGTATMMNDRVESTAIKSVLQAMPSRWFPPSKGLSGTASARPARSRRW